MEKIICKALKTTYFEPTDRDLFVVDSISW